MTERHAQERSERTKIDGYCGIYCGACSVLVHGKTGRGDAFIEFCKGIPRQALKCEGCRSSVVYPGCRVCGIRTCAVGKGVEHCTDCSEFPCTQYSNWKKGARLLPHVHEAASSLEQIGEQGVQAWLAGQKQRWSCPGCGAPFSWYAASCGECGASLQGSVYEMKGLRRLVCRILFPLLYRKGLAKDQRAEGGSVSS